MKINIWDVTIQQMIEESNHRQRVQQAESLDGLADKAGKGTALLTTVSN